MDSCLCGKSSTGCTDVVQNLRTVAKIMQLWKMSELWFYKNMAEWIGVLLLLGVGDARGRRNIVLDRSPDFCH